MTMFLFSRNSRISSCYHYCWALFCLALRGLWGCKNRAHISSPEVARAYQTTA